MDHLTRLPASIERFEEMPDGWRLDRTWGSPEHGWVPICNGKSLLNGGRKGLLRWSDPGVVDGSLRRVVADSMPSVQPKQNLSADESRAAAKTINQLARERFKEHMMQDLLFDLTVCKIEGWCSKQYITELKNLIDEVYEKVTGIKP